MTVFNSRRFIGCDLGFNRLIRPEFYGAYHEIVHATKAHTPASLPISCVHSENHGSSTETNSVSVVSSTSDFTQSPSPISNVPEHQSESELVSECSSGLECVTVVGNVCESGDVVGRDRWLPRVDVGDVLLVRDTGAYGYSMASNYNLMRRPAEVLVTKEGNVQLIRRAETFEDLVRTCTDLENETESN